MRIGNQGNELVREKLTSLIGLLTHTGSCGTDARAAVINVDQWIRSHVGDEVAVGSLHSAKKKVRAQGRRRSDGADAGMIVQ